MTTVPWSLTCVVCGATYEGLGNRNRCDCGETLDVTHGWTRPPVDLASLDARLGSRLPLDKSGVWRFRELVAPFDPAHVVSRGEGNTTLYDAPSVARYAGLDALRLKHEGENPTGSFKDRGMTAGVSAARALGFTRVACASTGNTSASMAAYAATADLRAYVFIPEGKIAYGKLSQSLAYGARTLQIDGDFDQAMQLVEAVCAAEDIYLLNSVNPFRIEGQKAIGFEILQDLDWQVPDWIALPGGNLGNSSAIGKGLIELFALGLIPRLPRLAVIQAAGAAPLYETFVTGRDLVPVKAETLATAIRIGDPVSWRKSLRAIRASNGVVERVTDQEILDAKATVDAAGIGAEPASCATVAGLKKLVAAGVVKPHESVVGVLTGHLLKDPDTVVHYHMGTLQGFENTFANRPIKVAATIEAVTKALS